MSYYPDAGKKDSSTLIRPSDIYSGIYFLESKKEIRVSFLE